MGNGAVRLYRKVAAMPGPRWLTDGLGLFGTVFLILALAPQILRLVGQGLEMQITFGQGSWVELGPVLAWLALAGFLARHPGTGPFAGGRFFLLFGVVPLLTALLVLSFANGNFSVKQGFIAPLVLCGLLVYASLGGLLGEPKCFGIPAFSLALLASCLIFLAAQPVEALQLAGAAVFLWLIPGRYVDAPAAAPTGGAAPALPFQAHESKQGLAIKPRGGFWAPQGTYRLAYNAKGLPVIYWLEPRATPDTLNFGKLWPLTTDRALSWCRRACFVHQTARGHLLLVDYSTEPAGRSLASFMLCLLGSVLAAGLLAAMAGPFFSAEYVSGLLWLTPAVMLAAILLEFHLRPHDRAPKISYRPWIALDSFEAVNTVDHYLQPGDLNDEGSIVAHFNRDTPALEVSRGIFNRPALIEFSRVFVHEFFDRRREHLARLQFLQNARP